MDSYIIQASQILNAILQGKTVSHEDLIEVIKTNICKMSIFPSFSSAQINDIALEYEKLYGSRTFKPGTTLDDKKGNDIWFYNKKNAMSDDEHAFENRYRKYLKLQHFGEKTIEAMMLETEKVLSLCSDPESNDKRRGLVMGDVQSGKTSNYLALANMACDYGYKIILILAGMTDSLRIQTQERIDDGFIGAISSSIGEESIEYVGVGKFELRHYAIPLTDDKKDFVGQNTISNDFNKPQVLVVKKNKSILNSVKQWLKPGSNNISSRNILIIDDECDNATVNTKKNPDDDPSAINGLIREIYNNFNCATYVGYTATPFANIFINPEKKVGNDDLFPSNFIHRLHASPEAYFGIEKVFPNNLGSRYVTILDEDEPKFLPPNHKKDYRFEGLTDSLRNAICNFLICNCIRTYRGDEIKHRSMMINISPYNIIQEDIKNDVELYVNNLKNTIFQYDKYPLDRFLKNIDMRRLYEVYQNDDFFNKPNGVKEPLNRAISFDVIKKYLYSEISKFVVTIVNNKYKGDQRFKYKDYRETGARVIAIGGYVLSRGLTLEGLMCSYFSRNASAYDTLLQMCRWFGYRPNYEDLCRIYMSQISYDSFGAVVDAIRDLDDQLDIMKVQGKAPIDFGLMIRDTPDTLETNMLITARNKSYNSMKVSRSLNYSGVGIDTSKIYKSKKDNDHNIFEIEKLCNDLLLSGYKLEKINNRNMFRNVKSSFIADFVSNIKIPLENKKFDIESISNFVREERFYSKWDIVFATGIENNLKYTIPGTDTEITSIQRRFEVRDDEKIIRISKNNNRLVEPGIFNSGLTDDQIEEAKKSASEREKRKENPKANPTPIAQDYLGVKDRNPLLVILPITLSPDDDDSKETIEKKKQLMSSFDGCLMGFAIGFAGKDGNVKMDYRINKVKQAELTRMAEEQGDEIDD